MKRMCCLASLLVMMMLGACAHLSPQTASEGPAAPARTPAAWAHNDPALQQGDLTIWKLQKMAENKEYAALNELFNNGLSMRRLPLGYAAGVGARVLNLRTSLMTRAVDGLTGRHWRGKIFYGSDDPRKSKGLNRIKKHLIGPWPIVPMAAFTTELLERHELVPDVKSNFVVLNYPHPKTKGYVHEYVLQQVQVFDVMVAVPGKYGPVYIGKTWLGRYDKDDVFHTSRPNDLIAWFFLDFNPEALEEQKKTHWDGLRERMIDWRDSSAF